MSGPNDTDGGMKVPDGIEALAQAVPSSIPPEMFEEPVSAAQAPVTRPKPVVQKPTSLPKMAAVKPASLPKMAAVKPASLPKMAAVKPASLPRMPAVRPPTLRKMAAVTQADIREMAAAVSAPRSDEHGAVTARMLVAEMPPAAVGSEPPPAGAATTDRAATPSSFPSSGKMLVFEVASPELAGASEAAALQMADAFYMSEPAGLRGSAAQASPEPPALPAPEPVARPVRAAMALPESVEFPERITSCPPSSVGGVVITPEHERLAANTGEDAGDDAHVEDDSRNGDTVEIFPKRRRPRAMPLLVAVAVGGIAALMVGGRLMHPRIEPSVQNPTTAAVQPLPVATTPLTPPAPARAAVTAPAVPAVASAAPPGTGHVSTATTAPGRRIFIDERTVGETPAVVVVPCGSHRVRIGSRGRTFVLDVPCGGEVSLPDR